MFISKYALQSCAERLEKDLFYSEANGKIFEVMHDLMEKGSAVDLTTVTAELDNRKILKQVGDVEYLTDIINSVPSAANVEEYIKIVEEKAILRRLINEATNIVSDGYNSTDDIGDILENAEKKILNVVKTRKGTEFRTIQDVLYKTQADLEKLAQTKGEITGLRTGFPDLDRVTSGLHENELIIIAARPAMEMGAEQLAMRMLASAGQIDQTKLRKGHLEHNDWKKVNEAISRLAETKIFIDDTPGMTMSEIKAKCRRLASSENGLGLVIIWFFQICGKSSTRGIRYFTWIKDYGNGIKYSCCCFSTTFSFC